MRHPGKTISASGSEADQDLEPEFTYDQLMADIRSLHNSYGVSPLKPGEFTVIMYAEANGLNRTAAMSELAGAVTAGSLVEVKEERRVNGKRVRHVYRKADK